MFDLAAELEMGGAGLSVVDVGAADLGERSFGQILIDRGLATLTAFEPDPAQYDALRLKSPTVKILPYALGDGREHGLNVMPAGMSSLLEPDMATYGLFSLFASPPFTPAERRTLPVVTRRLDDIPEIASVDFIKLDVQGAELSILRNAVEKLRTCSVIQVETAFVPLYKDQALFGDIDVELRRQGFLMHGFASMKRLPVAPFVANGVLTGINQLCDLDSIYVRDLRDMPGVASPALKAITIIMDLCYGSYDVTLRCLVELARRGECERSLPQRYSASLQGRGRQAFRHMFPAPQQDGPAA